MPTMAATSKYNRYDDGQMVRLQSEFKDLEGNYLNPTTVTLRVRNPDTLTVTTYTYPATVLQLSMGIYYKDIDTTDFVTGPWFYKWIGTGAVTAAKEWAFVINREEAI